ncbi:MAG: serine hydrolase, partial [Bacteroidota bacterium]
MPRLFFLLIAFSLSGVIFSQPSVNNKSQALKEANPSTAGFSAERLTRIDKVLQEYVDKKWIGGASAIVVHNGTI